MLYRHGKDVLENIRCIIQINKYSLNIKIFNLKVWAINLTFEGILIVRVIDTPTPVNMEICVVVDVIWISHSQERRMLFFRNEKSVFENISCVIKLNKYSLNIKILSLKVWSIYTIRTKLF